MNDQKKLTFDLVQVPVVRAVRNLADRVVANDATAGEAIQAFLTRQRAIASALGPRAADAHVQSMEQWLRLSITTRLAWPRSTA